MIDEFSYEVNVVLKPFLFVDGQNVFIVFVWAFDAQRDHRHRWQTTLAAAVATEQTSND